MALALLLALARHVVPAHLSTRSGEWRNFVGTELRDKTLGIVGLGRIGKGVCLRAQAFGMRVVAHDPYPDEAFAAAHDVTLLPLPELLATADAVSLHAALGDAARHLIGAGELASMKPTALLINTARGACVDEEALVEALQTRQIAGAGLDVFATEPLPTNHPLLTAPNVVMTPHSAGVTPEALLAGLEMTAENVADFLAGRAQARYVVAGPGR